jgi:hypothetical protein
MCAEIRLRECHGERRVARQIEVWVTLAPVSVRSCLSKEGFTTKMYSLYDRDVDRSSSARFVHSFVRHGWLPIAPWCVVPLMLRVKSCKYNYYVRTYTESYLINVCIDIMEQKAAGFGLTGETAQFVFRFDLRRRGLINTMAGHPLVVYAIDVCTGTSLVARAPRTSASAAADRNSSSLLWALRRTATTKAPFWCKSSLVTLQ